MKKFTRVIGLITSAVMLISSSAFAATVTPSVTASGEVTLTIDCGTENKGKLVKVQIY